MYAAEQEEWRDSRRSGFGAGSRYSIAGCSDWCMGVVCLMRVRLM